jgi:hypothetical protein
VWESARFTSIFLASSFSCSQALSTPAHTQVTQTVRQPKCKCKSKTKYVFELQRFVLVEDKKQFHFLATAFFSIHKNIYFFLRRGSFQNSILGQYFFSKQAFKFLAFSFGGVFFVGIVSGWFCPVAKIGFKVFGLRFGLRWF